MDSDSITLKPFLSNRPWVLFALFAVSSAVLSYGPVSLTAKVEWGFFGIILPLLWALIEIHWQKPSARNPLSEETLPRFSPWVFLLIILMALEIRLIDLTSWPVWPNTDEGLVARFGLDLAHQWRWRFFYTFGQVPPLYEWLLSWTIPKAVDSLSGLWILPAVVSILAFLFSYWAFRSFGSRSLAFLVFALWGLSFWPFFYGRFSHPGVLLPLWECLTLAVLGLYLKSKTSVALIWLGGLLGLATGLGSFTFTPWPVFALWVGSIVTLETFRGRKPRGAWAAFTIVFLIILIPFINAIFTEGYGHHIFAVSSARGYMPFGQQALAFISYLTAPFWGVFENQSAYAPFWGGMLNPLLTGAFLLGFLESWRHRRNPMVRGAWAGAVLCMMPGFLSMNVEMYRVILVLPFLLLGAAWGLLRLLGAVPSHGRGYALLAILILSFALDITHLAFPHLYPMESAKGPLHGVPPAKVFNTYRSYQILKEEAARGPGYFFNDFTSIPYDQSLDCAVYGFNALENPQIDKKNARWAAFLVNACYEPFLREAFPNGKWSWVDPDSGSADGGEMLGVVPLDDTNRETFDRWIKAYPAFRELDWGWLELADFQKGGRLLAGFSRVKPLLKDDPFLESVYWEKTSDLSYRDHAYPYDQQALGQAIREGFPAAHLFYKRGSIELRKNRFSSSLADFNQAVLAPGNRTMANQAVTMAVEIQKEGGLPVTSP